MRAILCQQYGPPEQLVPGDVPDPQPAAGQVLIGVDACGGNVPNTLIIDGTCPIKPPLLFVPGGEVAEQIRSVGDGVTQFKSGEPIVASTGHVGFAEQVKTTLPIPGGMAFVTAASPDEQLGICRELGVLETINYSTDDVLERIKDLTGGKSADAVNDSVCDRSAESAIRSLAWRYLGICFAAGTIPGILLNPALLKGVFARREPQLSEHYVQQLLRRIMAGQLKQPIYKQYFLTQAAALRDLLDRNVIGKAAVIVTKP